MLILNPRQVRFAAATWDDVTAIAIDRSAHKTIEEWTDLGPYAAVADVPEQKVRVTVIQEVARDDVNVPRPGDSGTLEFFTSPTASDAGRKKVSCEAIVLESRHDLSIKKGAIRTVVFAAISNGAADPITLADA